MTIPVNPLILITSVLTSTKNSNSDTDEDPTPAPSAGEDTFVPASESREEIERLRGEVFGSSESEATDAVVVEEVSQSPREEIERLREEAFNPPESSETEEVEDPTVTTEDPQSEIERLREETFEAGSEIATEQLERDRQELIILTRDLDLPTDNQALLSLLRELTYNQPPADTNESMVNTAIALGLRPNPNNDDTFISDTYPGVTFTLQPQDGSILVTSENEGESGTYIRNDNDYYTFETSITESLPGTEALTNLSAYRNADGTYSVFGNDNELFLQSDGSIYDPTNRSTYRNIDGTWEWVENTNPLPGTFAIAELGLTPTRDGYWTLPNDPRAYFIDEDGTVYTAGGGTSQDSVQPARRYDIQNHRWIEDSRSLEGSAYIIAKYNLIPQEDGRTYRREGHPDVIYIPQEDGSMFISEVGYTHINGQHVGYNSLGPLTFHEGRWDALRTNPLSTEDYIRVFGLTENEDRSLSSPRFNGNFYRLSGDRLYYIHPENNRHIVFNNGTWERASVEDYIEVHNLTTTGDSDGSLSKPGDGGRYYRLSDDRLLYVNGEGQQWIFGHYYDETRGHRTVWNRPESPVEIPNPPISAPQS